MLYSIIFSFFRGDVSRFTKQVEGKELPATPRQEGYSSTGRARTNRHEHGIRGGGTEVSFALEALHVLAW